MKALTESNSQARTSRVELTAMVTAFVRIAPSNGMHRQLTALRRTHSPCRWLQSTPGSVRDFAKETPQRKLLSMLVRVHSTGGFAVW
jgi:hypothetical protein